MGDAKERKIVKPWQAAAMLIVGIAIIVVGLLVLQANSRIVLAIDGVVMCFMAWCFGIKYDDLQTGIKETITSMIIAILILLAVGVLVEKTWMSAGTVPVMIYYGMKIITPGAVLTDRMHYLYDHVYSCRYILGNTGGRAALSMAGCCTGTWRTRSSCSRSNRSWCILWR